VSRDKNYSIRAEAEEKRGEISILIGSFNEMLGQIEDREAALKEARDELEERVEERTAQLAAANKELEAFSYSVSHDLRAPLRHIDGFSALLSEKYAGQLDPTAQRYLQRVREGARHMGHLVDDLLSMARIGRQEMVHRATDLGALVRLVIKEQESEIAGREIEWRIADLPVVMCDPGLMQLVFTNLIANAIKYSRKTARAMIEIGQSVYENKPVVFVRDNGAGFEQKYVHKLFGVFQRLHRAEDFEGTGIGLATVQRIIHRHGGQIWAEGEVDKGATFYFTIPE
jgi:light-regulated signal transduction histidine kinase (bacteriophytochrome)